MALVACIRNVARFSAKIFSDIFQETLHYLVEAFIYAEGCMCFTVQKSKSRGPAMAFKYTGEQLDKLAREELLM